MLSRSIFSALLILGIAGSAWSQQEPPIEGARGQNTQAPASEQRGTDKDPLTIKILPAVDAKEQAEKEERERREKATLDKRVADDTSRLAIDTSRLANETKNLVDYTGWLSIFTAALAVAAVFQIGLFWVQLRYMNAGMRDTKRSADIASESLVVGNAAFVFVIEIINNWQTAINDPEGNIETFMFRPIWKNSGNTQTRDMVTMVAAELRDSPLPANFDLTASPSRPVPALVGPQSTILGGSFRTFTVAEMEDVAAGRKFLYLWGWARYRDIFPDTPEHITRYCTQVLASGNLRSRPVPEKPSYWFQFLVHARGNCADGECVLQGLGLPKQNNPQSENASLSDP